MYNLHHLNTPGTMPDLDHIHLNIQNNICYLVDTSTGGSRLLHLKLHCITRLRHHLATENYTQTLGLFGSETGSIQFTALWNMIHPINEHNLDENGFGGHDLNEHNLGGHDLDQLNLDEHNQTSSTELIAQYIHDLTEHCRQLLLESNDINATPERVDELRHHLQRLPGEDDRDAYDIPLTLLLENGQPICNIFYSDPDSPDGLTQVVDYANETVTVDGQPVPIPVPIVGVNWIASVRIRPVIKLGNGFTSLGFLVDDLYLLCPVDQALIIQ